jgi:hypothetical protein
MDSPQDKHPSSPPTSRLSIMAALLLCLCVGAALLHANLRPRYDSVFSPGDGELCHQWSVGWPVHYGEAKDSVLPALCLPAMLTEINGCRVLVDLFVGALLVISPAMIFRMRSCSRLERGQFTLSNLFALTTAVAGLCALYSLECTYECANWEYERSLFLYTRLSVCPWYDQVAISFGIVCALYLAVTASSQVIRLIAARLSGRRRG